MIRRVFALLGGGAALLTFASCSTFETDNAATVNGHDISVDQLEKVGEQVSSVDNIREDFIDSFGGASGDLQRNLLGLLIDNELAGAFLESRGVQVTQDDRDAAEQALQGQGNGPLLEAGSEIADALTTSGAIASALQRVEAPTADEIAATYAEQPARLGVICANQIVVSSEGAATEAASQLGRGLEIDAVSAAVGATGDTALVGASGEPCPDLTQVASSVPAAVYRALLRATPGAVVGPFSSAGADTWTVLQIKPLADASDDLTAAIAANPGNLSYLGASATADVWVSSAYGAWDPATRGVVALSPAADGGLA